MRVLHRSFLLLSLLIILAFGLRCLNRLEITNTIKAGAILSSNSNNESSAEYFHNSWTPEHSLSVTRRIVTSDTHDTTIIAPNAGPNILLFGEWDTGMLYRLSNGVVDPFLPAAAYDLGLIRDIEVLGDTTYVASVERQQEYQLLTRISGDAIDSQWPGLVGGIGLLPLSHKQLLSGGPERTIYPYKVTTTLGLPAGRSFPQYPGKSAIKFARNSKGNIYVLDVTGGTLYRIELNQDGNYDWETPVILSTDYPRAVGLAIDEHDRIVLGIAGAEIHPLNEPRNPDPRIVLLEDTGNEVRLLGSKSDQSIRFFFGPRGGLVVGNGEVDAICSSDNADSIVRVRYDGNGFGEVQVILSTNKIVSGLALVRR